MEWKGELKSKNGRKTSRYMQLVAHDYRLRTNIYRVFNYVPTTILSSFNTSTNLIFTINLGDEYLLFKFLVTSVSKVSCLDNTLYVHLTHAALYSCR